LLFFRYVTAYFAFPGFFALGFASKGRLVLMPMIFQGGLRTFPDLQKIAMIKWSTNVQDLYHEV
jgi:hypothetical protein